MTEEIRPICLYIETCLDKKEGTRDCAKCEHHLNYWTEVMIRDMEKNITRLEQANKKLKKDVQLFKCLDTFGESECHCACRCLGNEFCEDADKKINKYRSALEEIREILEYYANSWLDEKQYQIKYDAETAQRGVDKINEVLNEVDR